MAVVTLGGEELLSSQWFPEVAIEVFSCCLPADLRVLKMHDFDVIFGMDWLSQRCTHLDCYKCLLCSTLLESVSFPFEEVSLYAASLPCLFLRRIALFVLLVLLFLFA